LNFFHCEFDGGFMRKIAVLTRIISLCLVMHTQLARSADVVVTSDADTGADTLRDALLFRVRESWAKSVISRKFPQSFSRTRKKQSRSSLEFFHG